MQPQPQRPYRRRVVQKVTSDALQWLYIEKRATAEAAVNGLTAEPVSELVLRLNNWLTEASPGHLVRSSQADNGFGCPRSLYLRERRACCLGHSWSIARHTAGKPGDDTLSLRHWRRVPASSS
jgi:hypothetical protein